MFIKERLKNVTIAQLFKNHKRAGFCDLLGYTMMLDDNALMHNDGALSAHFIYQGPDLASTSEDELHHHSQTWQQALSYLGNGWMIETNVIAQPFNQYQAPSEFPELVSALIDEERREQFEASGYYLSTYYLTITFKPETLVDSKFRRFAITDNPSDDTQLSVLESDFKHRVSEFIGHLKRSLLITPLNGNQLTTYLYQCITGSEYGLAKPVMGNLLSSYLAREDFVGGFAPKIGNKHILVLAIDDLPPYAYPAILDELSHLPLSYRWSSRFICLDKLTSMSYLKRIGKNWSSKAIGVWGIVQESLGATPKIDEDAQAMAELVKDSQIENSSGKNGFGFYNSNILLMDEDSNKLQQIAEQLKQLIQQKQFHARIETVNATEAYLGSLPGHGDYNLRKSFIDTQFVSYALPLSSLYQGDSQAPLCYGKGQPSLLVSATTGSRPFMLNLHIGDVGHTAILGPTGMGKTTLVSMLMASHRKYLDSRIVVMDKDYSNHLIIKALDGQYFDLNSTDCQFAPLARVSADNPRDCDIAIEWLVDIVLAQGVIISPEQRRLISDAVMRLADEPPEYRNLEHLTLQDPVIREAIQAFNSGMAKHLLNGTESLSGASVMGFEMGSLMQSGGSSFSNLIIKAIFNELDVLFQDKRPTLLILEEAWLYLKHPLFTEKLTDWFKTLRKANVSVIFISQDLSDIVNSDAASVIRTACMTRIYLPNKAAFEVRDNYASFGLSDEQIAIIKNAIPKQDYYYHSEKGARLFQLDMQPLTESFICIGGKADTEQFNQLYERGNPQWVASWLRYKKLNDWADVVEEQCKGE